ncbi:hypothetical protein ACFYWU_37760 [Streptomyces chrestomyceticus]|uniref:hypothetical protein n=1 Tax=Streptomyces chrestomyceticus TaxID=68185 RepID=UPI0036B021BE
MPGAAVVGEFRAKSRSADSGTPPTSSGAEEIAHGSASRSAAVAGRMMSSASRSRTKAGSGAVSARLTTAAPPPAYSPRRQSKSRSA